MAGWTTLPASPRSKPSRAFAYGRATLRPNEAAASTGGGTRSLLYGPYVGERCTSPRDPEVLVRILLSAIPAWATAIEAGEWWDRPAILFNVVLATDLRDDDAVARRFDEAGADVSRLDSSIPDHANCGCSPSACVCVALRMDWALRMTASKA
jgi:hypothetical protein